ncbi:hypothetical protein GS429_14440 [Natronorubrum sp. JWXQ-INN-674]|uniref:CHAT domain-containing protein n=1 Tax=Natronorubrum halalkaliphilum TaxID=2691917 RepID=A0A6B0VP10_9EURY|nr:hypothetical protein [Natronorubrum halalkaliphilum]MXV63244.1 hypothetical protein [Natronorubrum halalkaliphilum]
MKPKFESTDDGLEIIDRIERHRYHLTTHDPVSPTAVETDRIQFPVATAVEITAGMITLPTNETVYVRDSDGSMVSEVRPSKQTSLPHGTYTLDLSGPMKVYARVESSVYIYSDSEQTYITLDDSTRTVLGARSYHRRPAGTITTTAEPTDLMRAVSAFGSALKSTDPERSYPTHRGHPPAIELGDELSIPEAFERPETGIQIEVPPTLGHVFVVTPLAYYLGAEVVPGPEPRLLTKNGFTYDLDGEDGFEATVERVLKQVFFLDCVVRTEGPTPLPLRERQVVEPKLEFDVGELYQRELADQVETYLSVPFATVAPTLPEWRLETQLQPVAETVEFLPYLTDTLAIVSIQETEERPASATQTDAITAFTRGDCDFHRSANSVRGTESSSTPADRPSMPLIQQSWSSTTAADITSKTPLSAFHHSLDRTPRDEPIEIEVVCNDQEMREELETVNGVYGVREEIPFDVTVHYDTETDQLAEILAKNADFFHFIGHIDDGGFQCADGKLDVSSIETVGTKAFFLNACQSHDQGLQLVESGSIGGIVTIDDIINSGAVKVGSTIARLLNRGFPLYAALDVVRKGNIIGQQYFLVGDGMTTIAQSETGPPLVCSIERDGNRFETSMETYTKTGLRKGGLFIPYLEDNEVYFLVSGRLGSFSLTKSQVAEFLDLEDLPVITNGSVDWSKELRLDEL